MSAPESSPSTAATRAALALTLAGKALDPNTAGTPRGDLTLGAELLARALREAATALGAAPSGALADQLARLDDATLSRTAGSRERALTLARSLVDESDGVGESLHDAELFAARLVEVATHGRRLARAGLVWRAAKALFTLAALALALHVFWSKVHAPYRFTVSDSLMGFNAEGRLPASTSREVFFHTNETESPWVEVDLGEERALSRVTVTNRVDCCQERAVPMVVSVRGEAGAARDVARKAEAFDTWEATFASTRARYVRLTVPRRTFLHLRNVEVR